ncbi:MAG: Lanthionine biosynthesis cyclase LanC [uncultured Solirubrobacteraceae bacterium]|uniref:Lanthionine biosynthesis cyclase LanC n=1 Tax=uncultured Solirubrobacteraceae bacterium TaxID=1162706 RepID=A0A6J4RJS0_9ACTN|nr:MAG: Lanthionine biosynthesis cyclase LanC [uncultured Solirubrobacteraceae bacterium]
MAWRPYAAPDEREAILSAATELGDVLLWASAADQPGATDATLSRGEPGRALALAYLDDALPGRGYGDESSAALSRAVAAVAAQPLGPSLMQGFTGVAWAIAHLARRAGADASGATEAVDGALSALLRDGRWTGPYDHVSGLVGIGVYALERLPDPAGAELLELVVTTLADRAERADGAATWFTAPAELHPDARGRAPDGYYNLGVAHGVPGVVSVLAGATGAGVPGAAEWLDDAVTWLERQRLDDDAAAVWPFFVGPGVESFASRLAWCYGDPGITLTLLQAAAAREREDWVALADLAIEKMLSRAVGESGVTGASLCHGGAGLAHLCGRLHEASGRDGLDDMARTWARRTLGLRVDGEPMGGFTVWDPSDPQELGGDVQGPGFLAGIAGVALTLAAAATDVAPDWDRCLLVSLPESARP